MSIPDQDDGLVRSFIAVEIPEAIRNQLAGFQSKLKRSDADIKWVRPASMHLTLRFLGGLNQAELEQAAEAVSRTAKLFKPFIVEVKGFGTFPERGRPRVVWSGISQGGDRLKEIFGKLELELVDRGLGEADKPFSPHLTLGRTRSGKNINMLVEYLSKKTPKSFGSFEVRDICLFRSQLRREGAIYTVLKKAEFISVDEGAVNGQEGN
jgi:RNA 2',3'-cyclic 3'-phosphodiesterase